MISGAMRGSYRIGHAIAQRLTAQTRTDGPLLVQRNPLGVARAPSCRFRLVRFPCLPGGVGTRVSAALEEPR
jgi:hypothetical protein